MTDIETLRELLAKATPGPWHHVQAFQTVPAQKTLWGQVPGQRVDYVSTWPGPGTPKGHRVVVPMERLTDSGVSRTVSSEDMALIAAAVNALPELLDELERLRQAGKDALGHGRSVMRLLAHEGGDIVPYLMDTDDNPGQWFRYALVSLAAALKETDND